jgi:hypothetical protein
VDLNSRWVHSFVCPAPAVPISLGVQAKRRRSQCLEELHPPVGNIYNTTIRSGNKDNTSGEWKETTSFSPTELAVVSQLASQAFQEIVQLKAQSSAR